MRLPEKGSYYEIDNVSYLCLGYNINNIRSDLMYFSGHFTVEDYVVNYNGYLDIEKRINEFLCEACVMYVEHSIIAEISDFQFSELYKRAPKKILTVEEINLFLMKKKMTGVLQEGICSLLNLGTLKKAKAFVNSYIGEKELNKVTDAFISRAEREFDTIMHSTWRKNEKYTSCREFFVRDKKYLYLYIRPTYAVVTSSKDICVKAARLTDKKKCFNLYLSYLVYKDAKRYSLDEKLDSFSTQEIKTEVKVHELYRLEEFAR